MISQARKPRKHKQNTEEQQRQQKATQTQKSENHILATRKPQSGKTGPLERLIPAISPMGNDDRYATRITFAVTF